MILLTTLLAVLSISVSPTTIDFYDVVPNHTYWRYMQTTASTVSDTCQLFEYNQTSKRLLFRVPAHFIPGNYSCSVLFSSGEFSLIVPARIHATAKRLYALSVETWNTTHKYGVQTVSFSLKNTGNVNAYIWINDGNFFRYMGVVQPYDSAFFQHIQPIKPLPVAYTTQRVRIPSVTQSVSVYVGYTLPAQVVGEQQTGIYLNDSHAQIRLSVVDDFNQSQTFTDSIQTIARVNPDHTIIAQERSIDSAPQITLKCESHFLLIVNTDSAPVYISAISDGNSSELYLTPSQQYRLFFRDSAYVLDQSCLTSTRISFWFIIGGICVVLLLISFLKRKNYRSI
jgi:hypothetical protein